MLKFIQKKICNDFTIKLFLRAQLPHWNRKNYYFVLQTIINMKKNTNNKNCNQQLSCICSLKYATIQSKIQMQIPQNKTARVTIITVKLKTNQRRHSHSHSQP